MKRRLFLPIVLACATPAAAVTSQRSDLISGPLNGEALRATFTGSLLELDSPIGTTIPVRFGADGLVAGNAGALGPVLGAVRDRGRWRVAGDKLCLKFFRWFDAKERCLDITMDGTRLTWVDTSGERGTATLVEQGRVHIAESSGTQAPKAASHRSPPEKTKQEKSQQDKPAASPAKPVAPPVKSLAAIAPAPQPVRAAVSPPAVRQQSQATVEAAPSDATAIEVGTLSSEPAAATAEPAEPAPRLARFDFAAGARMAVGAPPPPPEPVRTVAPVAAMSKPTTVAQVRNDGAAAIRNANRLAPVTTPATLSRAADYPAPSFRVRRVGLFDVLNVRSGPSEYHERVGMIPRTARGVRITGPCAGEWCPVRHRRTTGWVNSFYLAEDEATSSLRAPPQRSATR